MEVQQCVRNPEDTPFVVITFAVYLVILAIGKLRT